MTRDPSIPVKVTHDRNAYQAVPKPGVRHQHIRMVQAIGEFVNGMEGESRIHIEAVTNHFLTNLWLAEKFLGVKATLNAHALLVTGVGFRRQGL